MCRGTGGRSSSSSVALLGVPGTGPVALSWGFAVALFRGFLVALVPACLALPLVAARRGDTRGGGEEVVVRLGRGGLDNTDEVEPLAGEAVETSEMDSVPVMETAAGASPLDCIFCHSWIICCGERLPFCSMKDMNCRVSSATAVVCTASSDANCILKRSGWPANKPR